MEVPSKETSPQEEEEEGATDDSKTSSPSTDDPQSTLTAIFIGQNKYDAILKCGYLGILAHRDVLSEKSEVFKTTFQLPSLNGIIEEIYISDIEAYTLQYMLRHIYSGEVFATLTLKLAMSLYKAAGRYNQLSLKWKCAKRICSLKDKTICDTLLMANERGYLELFDSAASHIASKTGFLVSKEWEDFCKKYPLLARIALPKIHEQLKYHRICQ